MENGEHQGNPVCSIVLGDKVRCPSRQFEHHGMHEQPGVQSWHCKPSSPPPFPTTGTSCASHLVTLPFSEKLIPALLAPERGLGEAGAQPRVISPHRPRNWDREEPERPRLPTARRATVVDRKRRVGVFSDLLGRIGFCFFLSCSCFVPVPAGLHVGSRALGDGCRCCCLFASAD